MEKNLLVEFVELIKSSIVRIDCPFIALGLVTNAFSVGDTFL